MSPASESALRSSLPGERTSSPAVHRAVARDEDEERFLAEVCRLAIEPARGEAAWIGVRRHDARGTLDPVACSGAGADFLARQICAAVDDSRPALRALRSGLPVAVPDVAEVSATEGWRRELLDLGFRSALILPLLREGEAAPFGVLAVYGTEAGAFPASRARELEELAGDVADGVRVLRDRSAQDQRLRHANAILRGVRSVNQLINRERDPTRLVQQAVEVLVEARGFDACCIAVTLGDGTSCSALAGEARLTGLRRMLESGTLPSCMRIAASEMAQVLPVHPASSCADCPVAAEYPEDRRAIAVPVSTEGACYGSMLFSLPAATADDVEEVALLQEVASDLAFALRSIAIERERDRAGEHLEASERRYRRLFQSLTEGMLIARVIRDEGGSVRDYRIVEVNPAFQRHTGQRPEEVLGKLGSEVYGAVSDRDAYQRVADTGEPWCSEILHPRLERRFRVTVISAGDDQIGFVFADATVRLA